MIFDMVKLTLIKFPEKHISHFGQVFDRLQCIWFSQNIDINKFKFSIKPLNDFPIHGIANNALFSRIDNGRIKMKS